MSIERNGLRVDLVETVEDLTFVVSGELDGGNAAFLTDLLAISGSSDRSRVVVDLFDLEVLTAAGMGVFVRFAEELLRAGKRLFVTNPGADTQRVLEVAGLDWLLGADGAQMGLLGRA